MSQSRSGHRSLHDHLGRRTERLNLGVPGIGVEETLSRDPMFEGQLRRLLHLQQSHVAPGTDLYPLWKSFVTHPRLIEMLSESQGVAAKIKGRRDLVAKRRDNILRYLSGPEIAMPLWYPDVPPTSDGKVYRLFRLRDELEYVLIAFYPPSKDFPYGRPVREVLTHDLVRAILDWKASHLDLWLSTYPHLIGGRITHPIPKEARKVIDARAAANGRVITRPREFVHEVRFSTEAFMRWYYANMN